MEKYPQLNVKNAKVRLSQDRKIFDWVRKKWLVLTPEEWVRQHMVDYLNVELNYPKSLMAIETGLKLNGLDKRTDVLLHGTDGKPLLLIECKAPSIKISEKTFHQIARYNSVLKVPFLLVTNGLNHYCCQVNFETQSFSFLKEIPCFKDLEATLQR